MKPSRFSSALVLLAVAVLGMLGLGLLLSACNEPPPLRRRTQTDTFFQEIRRTVDILLVVDNSCSMIDEQQKLAGNFDNFIEQFLEADVNYQIGVVTTDMSDPEHQGRRLGLIVCAAVIEHLADQGYATISLQTDDWRLAAIKTYFNLGFEPVMTRVDMPDRWLKVRQQLHLT